MSGDNSDFSVIFFFFFLLRMTLLVLFCTLDSLLLEDSFVPSDLRAWKGTVKTYMKVIIQACITCSVLVVLLLLLLLLATTVYWLYCCGSPLCCCTLRNNTCNVI